LCWCEEAKTRNEHAMIMIASVIAFAAAPAALVVDVAAAAVEVVAVVVVVVLAVITKPKVMLAVSGTQEHALDIH